MDGRIKRTIIAYGGTPYRTVYDRMMDRTIGVCDWYKLRVAVEVEKQADALLASLKAPLDKVYSSEEVARSILKNHYRPIVFHEPEEAEEMHEITTFNDLARGQRRYIMSNGITQVVVPIPEEEP
jgi:hypothetical protein